MTEKEIIDDNEYSSKKAVLYSLAGFTDVVMLQFFTFLIFTFYYSVALLHVGLITLGFVIWSIWNAFNDPMLGAISDKTGTKWGRRKPYIILGLIPLLVVNVLLWTPPRGNDIAIFSYFLTIIVIWELFYTMYSLNQTSLFPEMFRDLDQRARANTFIQFFQVISLLIAFILPSFFIPKFNDPLYFGDYAIAAVVISIICAVSGFIFIKFGIKERIEFSGDPKNAPSFLKSLKYTFGNKAFRYYVVGNFALWYAFGMLPTIIPLYGNVVLHIQDSTIVSMLLGTGFISAAAFVFLWQKLVKRLGAKNSYILALIIFIVTLSPFMFISDVLGGFISFFLLGIGLAGVLIVRDVVIAAIIDEDELKTGIRREAGYYGINGFFIKLSNVAIYISIAVVFIGADWAIFDPSTITATTELGLRSLMFIFPAVLLILGIISMKFFPINKEKYEKITEETRRLHNVKKGKLKV